MYIMGYLQKPQRKLFSNALKMIYKNENGIWKTCSHNLQESWKMRRNGKKTTKSKKKNVRDLRPSKLIIIMKSRCFQSTFKNMTQLYAFVKKNYKINDLGKLKAQGWRRYHTNINQRKAGLPIYYQTLLYTGKVDFRVKKIITRDKEGII